MSTYEPFSVPFCNDGGPMLVIPGNLVSYWSGADQYQPGVSYRPPPDDYERACAVTEFPALLDVGPGRAIVLAESLEPTTLVSWLRLDLQPGVMLALDVDPRDQVDAERVLDELRRAPEFGWEPAIPEYLIASDKLVLMHAVNDGASVELPSGRWNFAAIGNYLPVSVLPGHYAVERRRLDIEDTLVLRLRPL
ncbi:MAG TPA: Imm21 family immunity protein [Chloroflexota bacterium]|nr:Imm21 family immunity protein [Chloroflexota bacterium]